MSVTDTAFLTMTYCQVTHVFLCFLFSYRRKKKKEQKKKEKKNKHTKELPRPRIEPGTSRSPVLHFTTALMHMLRNTTERVFLNNGDYLIFFFFFSFYLFICFTFCFCPWIFSHKTWYSIYKIRPCRI